MSGRPAFVQCELTGADGFRLHCSTPGIEEYFEDYHGTLESGTDLDLMHYDFPGAKLVTFKIVGVECQASAN